MASAAPVVSFNATASASGVDITVANRSIPLLQPAVQAAGPTSQASLTSLGDSVGFASFPYPGEVAAGVTQVLSGVFGVPLPAYPLFVSTTSAPSSKSGGAPGIVLQSDSQVGLAQAAAQVGSGSPGATSRAEVVGPNAAGEGLSARASSTISGLEVGGIFGLSGGSSTATAAFVDGKVEVTSDLRIASIAIPGLSIRLPESTPTSIPIPIPVPGLPQLPPLVLPALPIPAPFGGTRLEIPSIGFENGFFTVRLPFLGNQKFLLPTDVLLSALKSAGLGFTYQTARPILQGKDVIGVLAPNLTISTVLPSLPSNSVFNGPVEVKVAFTSTMARLNNLVEALPGGAGPVTPPAGMPPTDAPPGSVDGPPVPPPSNSGVTGEAPIDGGLPPLAPGTGGSSDSGGLAPMVAEPGNDLSASPAVSLASLTPPSRDSMSIYLALVAVAAIGTLLSGAVRFQGIGTSWTS